MITEYVAYILISLGLVFSFLAVIGLLRFPDVFTRMHASTKCTTLGLILALLGISIMGGRSWAIKCILIIVFTVIGAPTGAHAIARAAINIGVKMKIGSYNEFEEDT
ncbi:MAG: monovalent cation/H(+) antiporter subunit G [Candidatus Methanofastidiosia archaeon]